MNLLKKLLLGVAPFAAFGSHCAEAASLLTPPPASVCTSPTVPTEPGDIHAFPGRWWNPNRIGIGWDLFYGDQQRSMYLTLFTYDVDGRPVWFTGESADTQFNAVTGESIWQSRLYRVKWKGMAYQTRDSVEVGLVSITFPRQTTTRAVVRWQFTESGNPWADTAIHDECLFDYYRDSANAGRGDAALSQAYSSNWFYDAETTHPYVGWGVDLLVALDEQQQYHETATVAIFDVNQNPVWLQSNDSYGVDPPPADTLTTLPSQRGFLRYFRHNRPNGRPMLSDCAEDSCLDITPLPGNQSQKNNRFLRNITGVRSGQMSVRAQVASGITGSTATEVNWPLPVPNTQPAFPDPTPVSHFDVDHVVVDKSICRVPPNTASCRFTVSWTSNDQGAIVTRVDLRNANNSRMIGGGGSGIVQDDIAVGDRIQYRIGYWNPNDGYSYRSTPEVRTLFDSDVADANVEPVDCASGPNCDLGEHDPTVGAIAGEASAEGGAAVYTIPIKVPPGRNGMQPAVSLSYNSRAGNGIAGMGWSLSAASAIHRCPRTLDQDGYSASVALGAGDALCLDGQRLLVLDALHGQPKADQTAGYGATGAVYRTEIDNFSRVTQLGGDLSAEGACFRVEHKDGRIAYYGGVQSGNGCSSNARNSRVSPAGVGVTLNWQLEKIEDRVGNNQFYFYTNHGNGEVLLSQIRYTGKDASEGNRRVVFESETRPMASDRSSSYIAGGLTVQTRRLKQIETWVGANEQVSVYKLDYEEPLAKQQAGFYSGRSQLQKITQCAYDGGVEKCLAPTTIDWNDAPPDFVLRPLSIDGLPAPSPMPNGAQIDPRVQPLGDLDGDGTREVVVHQWDIDPQTGVLRNATWLVKQTADRAVPESLDVTALATDIATIEPDHVADFDGDGRADILGAQNNWLYLYRWKKNRGDSFDSLANTFEATPLGIAIADQLVAIEDVDGDGRVDLLLRRSEGECNAAYVMPASQQDPQMLCLHLNTTTRSGGQAQIGFATGKRLDGWTVPSAQSGLSAPGDFNGDGVRDILVSYRTSIGDRVQHVLLSKAANAPVPKGCDPLD
ncbi:MAG TPA: SpvB/TcaC N-terminal domain-containing protein, partial [Tahibacter sp.]|nr:SpvB/TcaC N-terminal domain-containing protein [Tahibacter sp.]